MAIEVAVCDCGWSWSLSEADSRILGAVVLGVVVGFAVAVAVVTVAVGRFAFISFRLFAFFGDFVLFELLVFFCLCL